MNKLVEAYSNLNSKLNYKFILEKCLKLYFKHTEHNSEQRNELIMSFQRGVIFMRRFSRNTLVNYQLRLRDEITLLYFKRYCLDSVLTYANVIENNFPIISNRGESQ